MDKELLSKQWEKFKNLSIWPRLKALLVQLGHLMLPIVYAVRDLLSKSEYGRIILQNIQANMQGLAGRQRPVLIFLERLFKIESDDWPYVGVMLPIFFLVIFGRTVGDISTQSLFVSRVGEEFIPWMYFLESLGLFLISVAITSFIDRLNKERIFKLTLFSLAVIIIFFRLLLVFDVLFIYPLFFISNYIFTIILFGQFWLVANEICDSRQAKRIFGLISIGGILGAIISSRSISFLVDFLGTENLFFIWAVSLAGAAFMSLGIEKYGLGKQGRRKKKKLFTSLEEQFQDIEVGYKEVKNSRLLQTLGILIILCFALSYTLDYEFLTTLGQHFEQEDALTEFFAKVKFWANLATLAMLLFFTNRIIARFGQHTSMRVLPATYVFSFLAIGIFFNYMISSVAVFFRDVIFFAVYNPSYQMMYNAVTEQNRGRARSFIEGIGNPLALFSAFVITKGFTLVMNENTLGFVAAGFAVLFWYVSSRLKKDYEEALIMDLKRDDFSIREVAKSAIRDMEGIDLQKILYKALVDGDKDTAIFATEMLQRSGSPNSVNTLFFALRRSNDKEVKLKIIETIGLLGTPETGRLMASYFRSRDKDIQIASLKTLTNLSDETTANKILSLLRVRDPDIRATTAAVLWYLGDERGQNALEDMLNSKFDDIRRSATMALADVSNERMGKYLINLLKDESYEIRRYAIQGLGNIKYKDAIGNVVESLLDRSEDVRTAAQMNLPRFGSLVIGPLMDKFAAHKNSPAIKRRVVQVLGEIEARDAEDRLFDILFTSDGFMQNLVLHAFGKREHIIQIDKLKKYVLDQIKEIYRNFYFITMLQRFKDTTAGEALIIFLEEDNRHKQDLILQALGLIEGDINTFYLITKKLKSKNKYLRANAIETLENLAGRNLFHRLLPLIESPNNEQIRRALRGAKGETMSSPNNVLLQLLNHPHSALIRACTAYLLGERKLRSFMRYLDARSYNDEDPLVRENANAAVQKILLRKNIMSTIKEFQMLTILEKIFFLKKVPMFSNMSGEELRLIANICSEKSVEPGDVIMREKEYQDDIFIYIVISGLVSLTNITPTGEEKILKILKTKDYFGDIEVFDDQGISSVTVTAMEDTRLMTLGQKEFNNVLLEYPSIAIEICKVFSTKLRQMNRLLVLQY